MHIDWLTVVAQIFNFLLLVWLLKHFLYQPIINAMDKREQTIAEALKDAKQREQEANTSIKDYEDKAARLEKERSLFIEQAKETAKSERQKLLNQARSEVEEKRGQWQLQLDQERRDFLHRLKIQAAGSVQIMARKVLTDLADQPLEEQIVHSFIQKLETLDQRSLEAMSSASGSLRVTTSFELSTPSSQQIIEFIQTSVSEKAQIRFDVSSDLVCGIELSFSGFRLSWSIADYLEQMEGQIQAELGGNTDAPSH